VQSGNGTVYEYCSSVASAQDISEIPSDSSGDDSCYLYYDRSSFVTLPSPAKNQSRFKPPLRAEQQCTTSVHLSGFQRDSVGMPLIVASPFFDSYSLTSRVLDKFFKRRAQQDPFQPTDPIDSLPLLLALPRDVVLEVRRILSDFFSTKSAHCNPHVLKGIDMEYINARRVRKLDLLLGMPMDIVFEASFPR
jgi:hypothetical protein